MNTKILATLTIFLLSASCSNPFILRDSITINNSSTIVTEVVSTDLQKKLGLSNRNSLANNSGMLFDFRADSNKRPSFWMKDMKFSIDIIWIADNKIISIEQNLPILEVPENELPFYSPPADIDFVLEVNAGASKLNNWKVGDSVRVQIN